MKQALRLGMMLALLLAPGAASAGDFISKVKPTDPPQKIQALVFEGANGQQQTLSDYRGQFILVNVWATWCAPCVKEMPSLETAARLLDPHKLAIVPVSEDRDTDTVSAFYRSHSLTHLPIAVDVAGIAPSALHLHGLPTSLLIDPQGREIARIEGDAAWDSPDALAFLRRAIQSN